MDYSPVNDRVTSIQSSLLAWYAESARDLPWRHTRDPYEILVSEVMLQQTQVDRVVPKYRGFLDRFPSVHTLAASPTADVIRSWAPLGYNRRAVNLQRAAREIVANHGGVVPRDPAILRRLPGVGRYTAAAIACFAFGYAVPVVDTNVRRVLTRLSGAVNCSEAEIERLAQRFLPAQQAADWSQALMDLSAAVCRPVPLCLHCPLQGPCQTSGSSVREARTRYSAATSKERRERFVGSNRYLRGRIVDLLRDGDLSCDQLAGALGLDSNAGTERLDSLLAELERDGLVHCDAAQGMLRLPT